MYFTYSSMLLRKKFKMWCLENNKTQIEVAKDLKISPQAITSWMSGDRFPRLVNIRKIMEYTQGAISIQDFMDKDTIDTNCCPNDTLR